MDHPSPTLHDFHSSSGGYDFYFHHGHVRGSPFPSLLPSRTCTWVSLPLLSPRTCTCVSFSFIISVTDMYVGSLPLLPSRTCTWVSLPFFTSITDTNVGLPSFLYFHHGHVRWSPFLSLLPSRTRTWVSLPFLYFHHGQVSGSPFPYFHHGHVHGSPFPSLYFRHGHVRGDDDELMLNVLRCQLTY